MKILIYASLIPLLVSMSGCAPLIIGGAAATGIIVAQDRRTTGTMLNDQRIEIRIKDFIVQDKEMLEHSHVKVHSYNGIVLLTGETAVPAMSARIEDFARNETHVREVRNELRIESIRDISERRGDITLNSSVRTRLFSDPDVKSSAIKVITDRGTVYLMGLVTRAEAERAVEATRKVQGVSRIVRIFEYVRAD